MNRQKATKQEIFSKLETLLGPSAPQEVATIVGHYQAGITEAALETIAQLEEQIGGQYGVMAYVRQMQTHYKVENRGIYRPFYYIRIRLTHAQPQHFTRDIVRDACLHIVTLSTPTA